MNGKRRELSEFETQFPEMFTAAYRAALRVGARPGFAEEVAAEAAYRAAVRWSRVSSYCVPWVVRVATNLVIDDHRRSRKRHISIAVEPVSRDEDHTLRLELVDALRSLPARQREVIVLRYVGDFSESDICTVLRLSPGTVKSHTSRGLSRLREELEAMKTEQEAPE